MKVSRKFNPIIILIAIIAGLGGFVIGFDAGVIVDGKDQISRAFSLNNLEWSYFTTVSVVGAYVAVMIGGRYVDRYGSKLLLVLTALGFIGSALITATAISLPQLILGRFAIGLCIGIASFTVPLFISELSPPSIRGSMVLINGVAITGGQTISFLVAYYVHDLTSISWRIIVSLEIVPALILLVGMLYLPRSPRWVAKKHGLEEARMILKRIRKSHLGSLEKELLEIQETLNNKSNPNVHTLFSYKILPIILVGMGLGLFQQLIGISAIMSYGPVIFQAFGAHTIKSAIYSTFLISLINLIFTLITAFVIDYVGRRFLLLLGTFIAAISMILISFTQGIVSSYWIILFMGTYMIGYCISLGSLFWVMISEIFPLSVRGLAMSTATSVQYIGSMIVSLSFLQMLDIFGNAITFSLFGVLSIFAFIFIYFFVPETKGVKLELIEMNLFNGVKTRHLGQNYHFSLRKSDHHENHFK